MSEFCAACVCRKVVVGSRVSLLPNTVPPSVLMVNVGNVRVALPSPSLSKPRVIAISLEPQVSAVSFISPLSSVAVAMPENASLISSIRSPTVVYLFGVNDTCVIAVIPSCPKPSTVIVSSSSNAPVKTSSRSSSRVASVTFSPSFKRASSAVRTSVFESLILIW